MKKLLFALVAVCIAYTASAQLVQSTTVTRETQVKKSGMFFDFGVGTMTGKMGGLKLKAEGTALGLGLGYRQGFNQYIAWDIVGVNAFSQTEAFDEDIYIQGISALRGTSPVFFAKMSAFASAGLGYGYFPELEGGGLAFELKFGINLTPSINIGFRYNSQKVSMEVIDTGISVESTFGVSAFNLGFLF